MNYSSFDDYRRETSILINEVLDEVLGAWVYGVSSRFQRLDPIARRFADSCRPGKRVRGTLVRLGYELVRPPGVPAIYSPAAAFEVIQTSLLVHDDIMDNSPLRRGAPTIHAALGGDQRGVSHAICLGDVGFFLAFDMIAKSQFPDALKSRAIQVLSRTLLDTGVGQMWDVELPRTRPRSSEHDVTTLFEMKTAQYTITGPLQLGAVLAGAEDEYLEYLASFGRNLGIAFQIHDDLLGAFGNEEELGKPATSDIAEGKNTLLYVYASQHANQAQREILLRVYGAGSVQQQDAELVRRIFVDTGAVKYARGRAESYTQAAEREVADLTQESDQRRLLEDLGAYLLQRKS